ncbi:MBL fold metallo-hydrolase [Sphingobacterium sp. lm-10]|uniref:MBL fold metallo-hydrolase n=1 Tax=Sphingobacterium sp. lm-10 TaxID=2944904 RepID=UPI0020200D22|nr:MBL fold metallo-hydrolase [Sphingobacterium sp. lm-10]MCL7986407.1 MBL fold metallo-hydrolase [Sphingobacterium sp. lm-10]
MWILIVLLALLALAVYLFSKQDKIGYYAKGERLQRMEAAPNFKDGVFDNLEHTPSLAEGETMLTVMRKWLFTKNPNKQPLSELPHVQTNLKSLPLDSNLLVWFGHSSYYLQLDGKRILVDPVFSGSASPVNNIKAFLGTNTFGVNEMPEIDLLIISHDHWDHLDYATIRALEPKMKRVLTGLGVGAHFEGWGYPATKITELYWGETADIEGLHFTSCTARHFSGRWLTRNTSLWSSFAVRSSNLNIYLGGDSGYGSHFKKIGAALGPFDWAILENGQYNTSWRYIHMLPDEVVQASQDLRAQKLIPVHSAKFVLSIHDWDEPLREVTKYAKNKGVEAATPQIGEVVYLNQNQSFAPWWENL